MRYRVLVATLFCASPFIVGSEAPSDSTSSALVTVEKGYKNRSLGTGSAQIYTYTTDKKCDSWKKIAGFRPLTGTSKTISIPAEKRVTFKAFTRYLRSTGSATTGIVGVQISSSECTKQVSFIPKSRESYKIVQYSTDGANCHIEAIAASTGLPPSDLEETAPQLCEK